MQSTTSPKTILITGASSGIGAAAAQQLNSRGHEVLIVGRSPEKTIATANALGVQSYVADFARLGDVRELAAAITSNHSQIDVLANNAGGVFGDRTKTVDGFDQTFQINHLAPFLFTQLLMDNLISSKASVIQTSSLAARLTGNVELDDLNHDRDFNATRAYGTAKLENILFTRELHRRYHSQGLSAVAFHPGIVATSFGKGSRSILHRVYSSRLVTKFMLTPERAAEQLVWFAESTPGMDWESGLYYENRKPTQKFNKQMKDEVLARELWERSEELLASTTEPVA